MIINLQSSKDKYALKSSNLFKSTKASINKMKNEANILEYSKSPTVKEYNQQST